MPEPQVRADAQAIKDWMQTLWAWLSEQMAYGAISEAVAQQRYKEAYYQLYPEMAVEDRPLSREEAFSTLSTADLVAWAEDPMGFRPVERAPMPLFKVTGYQTVINWAKAKGVAEYTQLVKGIEDAAKEEAKRLGEERELFAEELKAAGELIERKRFERATKWQDRQRAIIAGVGEEKRQRLESLRPPTEVPIPESQIRKQWQERMKDLPYTAQQHFRGQLGEFFGRIAPAYEKWWSALHRIGAEWQQIPSGIGKYPGEAWQKLTGEVAPKGMPTPEEWEAQQVEAGREAGAEQREQRAKRRAILEAGDPFQQYMSQFPFMGEFMQVPRRQRGFYPGRSAPRARWFT